MSGARRSRASVAWTGAWDGFSRKAPREIPLMAAELAGTKHVPAPQAAD